MQSFYYYAIILLGILVFFSVCGIFGKIAFGYGLGDVFFLLILWGITLIFFITFLLIRNNPTGLKIASFLFTIPTIWIILMATIWRSVEYPWNGELFYPSYESKEQYANEIKRWESEKDSLKLLIKTNPEEIKAYARIGQLSSLLRNKKEAIKYYEIAIQKGDNSPRFRLAREYESLDMIDKAIIQYEEMLKIDSTSKIAKLGYKRLKSKQKNKE